MKLIEIIPPQVLVDVLFYYDNEGVAYEHDYDTTLLGKCKINVKLGKLTMISNKDNILVINNTANFNEIDFDTRNNIVSLSGGTRNLFVYLKDSESVINIKNKLIEYGYIK